MGLPDENGGRPRAFTFGFNAGGDRLTSMKWSSEVGSAAGGFHLLACVRLLGSARVRETTAQMAAMNQVCWPKP